MRKITINILGLVILASLIFSCNNSDKSLQQFIVNQQEKIDIISLDFPVSLLALQEELLNEEDVEILKSIKKANLLAYKIKDSSNIRYKSDKEHLKNIFKQKKYTELVRYGKGSEAAKVYMVGEENAIDEIIVFANKDSLGWMLLRILGDDMKPEKIIQLMQKVDIANSDFDLSQIEYILQNRE